MPVTEWELVGAAIKAEMDRRGWTVDKVYKETKRRDRDGHGVGPSTLRSLIGGAGITRLERLFVLFDLFGWSNDSLASIQQGGEPISIRPHGVKIPGEAIQPGDLEAMADGELMQTLDDLQALQRSVIAELVRRGPE